MTDVILVIEDDDHSRKAFCDALSPQVGSAAIQAVSFDKDAHLLPLEAALKEGTLKLVVTDLDLTKWKSGIRGRSVVEWCEQQLIPVAVYSKATQSAPVEPSSLFEIVVPSEQPEAYAASVYRGFARAAAFFSGLKSANKLRSPAHALALLLRDGTEDLALERQLSGYSIRMGTSAGNLLRRLVGEDGKAKEDMPRLLSYLAGHLLLNNVLRFPGPLVNGLGLQGYFSTTDASDGTVMSHFADAAYSGPFSETGPYFWREGLDRWVDAHMKDEHADLPETLLRRAVLEAVLDRTTTRHKCSRCGGENGGFVCPFRKVIVCDRNSDCSVSSDSWLPPGATMCRVEREHFDEWGPLLGR